MHIMKGTSSSFFNEALNWAQAKATCELLGGHLATSTSVSKNKI